MQVNAYDKGVSNISICAMSYAECIFGFPVKGGAP